MSWFSAYNASVVLDAGIALKTDSDVNLAAFDPLAWPAHDMDDGLDLPTFDLYVKSVFRTGANSSGLLSVPVPQISVGRGISFNVLRQSEQVIRKHADHVEFQGTSRVSYAKLRPFIQELLVLHHPHLQRKKVLIGLVGFAWSVRQGVSDMLTVVTPALDLEFAQYGNMAEYLKSKPLSQSLQERRILCHQVLAGLKCLHDCQIAHGDLKLENILVCSSETEPGIVAKLSDFGLSMFVNEMNPDLQKLSGGTQPWNSPEWKELRPSRDFYKSDIYSVGLLVWASFSPGQDPFNWEERGSSDGLEISLADNYNQRKDEIEDLKRSDKVLEIACHATEATLASIGQSPLMSLQSLFRWRSQSEQPLFQALKIVFENALRLDPSLRSLQPGIEALYTKYGSARMDKKEDEPPTWWGEMYISPRRISPKSLQVGLLRGDRYIMTAGAPTVARLSVAISKAIYHNPGSFTLERRRDAAYFLFRCYFENYGVEEDPQNKELAAHWLLEFGRLGTTSGSEQLCFSIAEFNRRMGRDMPLDFTLESGFRVGIQSILKSGAYIMSILEEYTRAFPNLLNDLLLSFRLEGIRQLLPPEVRTTDLSTLVSAVGKDNSIITATALLHIAASCGDIHTASLLVEKYDIDLNVRVKYGDFTPLITALKYSQAEFVLWLLRQDVKASMEIQRVPVLLFINNFGPSDASAICDALCQAGASVNDYWYFDLLHMNMSMLAVTAWAFDLAMVDLMLAQQPSIWTCENALLVACFGGRLDAIKRIESHMTLILKTPLERSHWNNALLSLTRLSPYLRLALPQRPDFIESFNYVIERLGGELEPKVLYEWFTIAIMADDHESLSLCLEQTGSAQFLSRTRPFDESEGKAFNKSALESAVLYDRKALFDFLLSKGAPIELEQSEDNFPTLLHTIAQRDLLNGEYFCIAALEKGEKLEAKASASLSGVTAFEVAVRYKNYEIAILLLKQGAYINASDAGRMTPLGDLIGSQSFDAIEGIKFLLEHPLGKPSFIVERETGRTALHLAAGPNYDYDWQYLSDIGEQEAIMDLVLEHYNEPKHLNARDMSGFTALHHATYRGCDWAVKKLLKAGADPNVHGCLGVRPMDCALDRWWLSTHISAVLQGKFDISSPSAQIRRSEGRLECFKQLSAAGAGDIEDSMMELGLFRYLMGCFGLINNAKEDQDPYEPWTGEFPLQFVTKWIVKWRNNRVNTKTA